MEAQNVFQNWTINPSQNIVIGENPLYDAPNWPGGTGQTIVIGKVTVTNANQNFQGSPKVQTFPLANIDTMRDNLMSASLATAYTFDSSINLEPYSLPLQSYLISSGPPIVRQYSTQFSQEGLPVRTYASDLFNNWIKTEWIS